MNRNIVDNNSETKEKNIATGYSHHSRRLFQKVKIKWECAKADKLNKGSTASIFFR